MKPGDLVNIVDYSGYYSTESLPIGVLVKILDEIDHPYEVLINGTVKRYDVWFIRPLEKDDTTR